MTVQVRMLEGTRLILLIASLLMTSSFAFTVNTNPKWQATTTKTSSSTSLFAESSSSSKSKTSSSLIVISPPGGIGEVVVCKAASMGASVRWFVISPPTTSTSTTNKMQQQQVVLSQQTLNQIQTAGGIVELAGADATSLLLPEDDVKSAVPAVSAWCGGAGADASIICTFDGTSAKVEVERYAAEADKIDPMGMWKDAIKVAAQQASALIRGKKLAILSLEEGMEVDDEQDDAESSVKSSIGNLVGGLFGGSKIKVPATLVRAMSGGSATTTTNNNNNNDNIITLRHGTLFGIPESSPDFSALKGGPRKIPELCEEYSTRTVRVDPSLSMSGNVMMGKTTRSSRHAIGEAAALLAMGYIPISASQSSSGLLDISISSQRGIDPPTLDTWLNEFNRVNQALSSGAGAKPQLFSADFGSVPDIGRLTGWLATKWAPTVLRTYDIAAIRKGARPVYASKITNDQVEIVWQELSNFQTITSGRMLIQVSDTGLVALRAGPGDAKDESISRKPLQGEDVLVRRLAEAASQAIEKGLANKPKIQKEAAMPPKPKKVTVPTPVVPAVVVSTLQSSGTVVVEDDNDTSSSSSAATGGPRQAGARRSVERARGKKRKGSSSSSATTTTTTPSEPSTFE